MDIRKEVLTKLEGKNLRYVARDSGVSYGGIYGLVTRGTAAYETILALYQYFERRKEALNARSAQELPHIDGNKMNNHGLRRDNTSGYPGVSFYKAKNKYVAQIRVNGILNYLGLYPTAEEAFQAYQLAKKCIYANSL